ncbi:MAG TPA: hypothetical protein VKM55_14445 [Candidatus Lokiarchaeia archaeon]|nr:hypothetical protein [Candidatus Lokiarchaeia archaeon]
MSEIILQINIAAVLLYFTVAGIIVSIVMIILNLPKILNVRRSWYRARTEPLKFTDLAVLRSFKRVKYGLITLICSALCCGIATWNLEDEINAQIRASYFWGCISQPVYAPWIIIVTAAALVTGWLVVARSEFLERTRSKLITECNIMDNETRRKITSLVENYPGIHFSRIKSMLGLSPRTIRDQLYVLLSFGKLSALTIDGKKSYFLPNSGFLESGEKQPLLSMLAFFQRGGMENLLRTILHNPGASFTSIVNASREPRSTIRRKLNAFEHRKYVRITRIGREMTAIYMVPSVEKIANQVIRDKI